MEANLTILLLCRSHVLSVYYDLNVLTLHLLSLCNVSVHCVGLDRGKGKGFPNKLGSLREGMECLAFTFILIFGPIVTAVLSAVRACSILHPRKFLRILSL